MQCKCKISTRVILESAAQSLCYEYTYYVCEGDPGDDQMLEDCVRNVMQTVDGLRRLPSAGTLTLQMQFRSLQNTVFPRLGNNLPGLPGLRGERGMLLLFL